MRDAGAGSHGEVELDVQGQVTLRSVLDALEARYPVLRGTIRDHLTQQRRPFLRFFACQEDLSLEPPDTPLPEQVASAWQRAISDHCEQLATRRLDQLLALPPRAVSSDVLQGKQEPIMPNDSHQRAAEFHEQARAQRTEPLPAAKHGQGDHKKAYEASHEAIEHSAKAYQFAQEAHRKSEAAAAKKE